MLSRITRSNIAAALMVAAAAAFGSLLAQALFQAALAFALLVFLFGLRLQSRKAALVFLWMLWLFVPLLRRVLELTFVAPSADPLVVLPIAATLLLALMEFREDHLNQRARTVLTLAGAGFLIGAPVGLTVDPAAAIFAGLAYTAGLSALILGWGEEIRAPNRSSMVEKLLTFGLVPIALYGIAQYFLPLASWDSQWVEAVEGTELAILSPQEGHIRIFATLNSPFTFAVVLAIGIVFALGLRRRARVKAMIIAPLVIALALTYVRSAWLALIVGVIVYAASGDDRSAGKTVAVVIFVLAAVVVVGGSNPTTKAFTERLTSLGSPGSDYSANDRFSTSMRLIPEAAAAPVGKGLGQSGLAAKLNESKDSGVVNIDDGYLATLYQSGPIAFLLMMVAFFAIVRAAMQALVDASVAERPYRAAILAILVMMLVAQATGDVTFGVTGVIFWYLGGISLAAAARRRVLAPATTLPRINADVSVANV
jgi:putative inorganic carbon (HCO3(-)) transporter